MILKTAAIAIALCLSAAASSQAIQITNFGSSTFQVDSSAFPETTSGVGSITLGGNTFGGTLTGIFDPVEIGDSPLVTLTASISGINPDSFFSLVLFNSTYDQTRTYTGFTSGIGSFDTTITLSLDPGDASVDFTDIGGLQFTLVNETDSSFSMTLKSVDAVPEPSVYAFSAIGLAGAYLLRRRRGLATR